MISFKNWSLYLTIGFFVSVSYSNSLKSLPKNMPLHTKILWGENGILRKVKFAPETRQKVSFARHWPNSFRGSESQHDARTARHQAGHCKHGQHQTIRQTLEVAGILPSTVVVSYDDRILPHSTVLNSDINLLVTTVSSGG